MRIVEHRIQEILLVEGRHIGKRCVAVVNILVAVVEAIVGAIYLDAGLVAAREFVLSHLGKKMAELKTRDNFEDSKTQLQERFVREKVVYNTKKTGEDHSPVYVSNVLIGGVVCGHGEAGNKRTAEMMAASEALKKVTKV